MPFIESRRSPSLIVRGSRRLAKLTSCELRGGTRLEALVELSKSVGFESPPLSVSRLCHTGSETATNDALIRYGSRPMPRTFAYCCVSTADQTTDNLVCEVEGAGFAVAAKRIVAETVSG